MSATQFSISARLIDIENRRTYPAEIQVADGRIVAVQETESSEDRYILPGFIDAHIHIESSMLVPSEFARLAVVHGTVATVSDPHEIANVCGVEGVQYMIDNSKKSPFKFFFGAPSCVPATGFETAGATLDAEAITALMQRPDIWYLSEMMNYPGVLNDDAEISKKIDAARKAGKPVDGHAPGLRGADVMKYAAAGISTDHECFAFEEAIDKINAGMKVAIREGSAAKNYEALSPLIPLHPEKLMFCSDDKHPDELVLHHIDALVKRSLAKGYDLYDVLRIACVNPVLHYRLPVGLLRRDDPADFIIIDSPASFNILETWIDGKQVAKAGETLLGPVTEKPINAFSAIRRRPEDLLVKAEEGDHIRVIEALEGQLITNELTLPAKIEGGYIVSDTEHDVLKIAVVNRYDENAPVAVAFIRNFGLKAGALASTIAHDCHNIIAVGADDAAMINAINALVDVQGGIAVASGEKTLCMPLPVAGLMSTADGYRVAEEYTRLDKAAKALGTPLKAPFMTLSFMALLVIPALKLSDKGLFNGCTFSFTPLQPS